MRVTARSPEGSRVNPHGAQRSMEHRLTRGITVTATRWHLIPNTLRAADMELEQVANRPPARLRSRR